MNEAGLPAEGGRKSEPQAGSDVVLRAESITHRFGPVTALEDVTMDIETGRVLCLLGDNGAGKSTLIKVLSGVFQPTAGRLVLDGQPARFDSPRDALARGVATVYQDLALVPLMSIWRNFFLGAEPTVGRGPLRRIDVHRCRAAALEALAGFGIRLEDAERPVGTLSGGERQSIAIARAVHRGARVLILDEPTAALGARQADLVLELVVRVRNEGVGVVLITHDERQARQVADSRVVLERGRVVAAD